MATARLFEPASGADAAVWDDVVVLRPAGAWWQPRRYVPLITRYFEEGKSRCLVGTRGLLGEGWDAQRVNVLIDLTGAGTSTAVHQMRGRSLRLDPALPDLRVARVKLLWNKTFNFPAETALRELTLALLIDPNHAGALRLWASVTSHLGLVELLRPAIERRLADDPNDGFMRVLEAGIALQEERPRDTLTLLAPVLRLDPGHDESVPWWQAAHAAPSRDMASRSRSVVSCGGAGGGTSPGGSGGTDCPSSSDTKAPRSEIAGTAESSTLARTASSVRTPARCAGSSATFRSAGPLTPVTP